MAETFRFKDLFHKLPRCIPHDGSMGLVYLPTWMVHFYGFHVGKYTSPMDGMGTI